MEFMMAFLKIVGRIVSIISFKTATVISAICNVASGPMEMKDVVEKFRNDVAEHFGKSVCIIVSYFDHYYETGKYPHQVSMMQEALVSVLSFLSGIANQTYRCDIKWNNYHSIFLSEKLKRSFFIIKI